MNAVAESIDQINLKYLILLWCDQILITKRTIENTIKNYNYLVLPVTEQEKPYVQISVFSNKIKISETIEGDIVSIKGKKDIGLFKINRSYFKKLILKNKSKILEGKVTKEKNFLKLFEFMQLKDIKFIKVQNSEEGLGINDKSDVKKVYMYLNNF